MCGVLTTFSPAEASISEEVKRGIYGEEISKSNSGHWSHRQAGRRGSSSSAGARVFRSNFDPSSGQAGGAGIDRRGVDVIHGDLDDPASLTRALDGVYGVYSVQQSTAGAEAEIRQGINLADAANRSGISHLVYSSVASADQNTGIPHFDSKFRIEEHTRGTGIRYTIFRPVFSSNWFGTKSD